MKANPNISLGTLNVKRAWILVVSQIRASLSTVTPWSEVGDGQLNFGQVAWLFNPWRLATSAWAEDLWGNGGFDRTPTDWLQLPARFQETMEMDNILRANHYIDLWTTFGKAWSHCYNQLVE